MAKITCKFPCPSSGLHPGEHLCCCQCASASDCEQACPMHYTECVDLEGDSCVLSLENDEGV